MVSGFSSVSSSFASSTADLGRSAARARCVEGCAARGLGSKCHSDVCGSESGFVLGAGVKTLAQNAGLQAWGFGRVWRVQQMTSLVSASTSTV